jgi:glutamine synthetase
MFQMSEAF